jgi:DNA-binding response OmpR family regulator
MNQANALRRLRVLIVDDNRDAANTLGMLVEIWGHETRVAYDGEDGLRLAKEFEPDVVLLDIGLPKLNGYELAHALRDEIGLNGATIIAISGYGEQEDFRRSYRAGCDYYLVKPADPNTVRHLLET